MAIDVKFLNEAPLQQDVYIPQEIAQELAAAAERAHRKDKSVFLLKEGDHAKGLTKAEWGKEKKSLDAADEGYTLIKQSNSDMVAFNYQGGKLVAPDGAAAVTVYDKEGHPSEMDVRSRLSEQPEHTPEQDRTREFS